MDIIGCLPLEISQHILLYLGLEDIDVVWNYIGEWRHIISDNNFWKKVCRRNDYQENEECLRSDIYSESMLQHFLRWQAIYAYNRLIESNWTSGNYKSISISSKNKKYARILYFDDEILVASLYVGISDVHTEDIIDLSTGNIYFTLNEKYSIITIMIRHQNLLIYFVNKTLKFFNLETKSLILNLKLTESISIYEEIRLEVYNNLLAVLDSPDFFYMVNLETKKVHFKLLGVFDSCFGDNVLLVALNCGKKIQVLDLNGKLLMNFNFGEGLGIENIMMKGGYVIIYYSRRTAQVFHKVSLCTIQQETKSLQEIRSVNVFYKMCFPNECAMLCWNRRGLKFSSYNIWRFLTENHYVSFEHNGKELLWAIANNRYIFLYTKDSVLNMWCIKTGKFIKNITKEDMTEYFFESFRVTEKKFAYINSEYCLCIQNYDFIAK